MNRGSAQELIVSAAQRMRAAPGPSNIAGIPAASRQHRVLIVDDESANRNLCRLVLESENLVCIEASDGMEAIRACQGDAFDLILLDVDMPRMGGSEVLRHVRESPPCPHMKVIMLSGRVTTDDLAQLMIGGADDYLSKPFSVIQLRARVKSALRLKDAQDRSDRLNRSLVAFNRELEDALLCRDSDLVHARNALVLGLAELVGYRDAETGAHLMRLQRYTRCLAQTASRSPSFRADVDDSFIQLLECCAPLHDIGKAGLPDHILLKPGKLDPEERLIMQTHTTIGANTLEKVAERHAFARAFLEMAIEITRHHHERYDGSGYPDHLVADDIPLSARIVAIADVYDALRSRRVYKPALNHASAVNVMIAGSPGHFDPALLQSFAECSGDFDCIYAQFGQ
jgi:response regulator RpfG family c-di-GMP phosphodiesterase